MAITQSELYYKYTGTAGTTNPETSLGGTISLNTIPSGVDNNIFDDVTGNESSIGASHYRAIGIYNSLGTHIWMNTSIRVDGFVASGGTPDTISFGVVQPAGAGGVPDGTIPIIGSETIDPGVAFTAEDAPSAWVAISGKDYTGSIGPDDWAGIWLARSIPAGASAVSNRSCTIRVQGETSASPLVHDVGITFRIDWNDTRFSLSRIMGEGVKALIE